jgi:Zn-dependent protease with chaperone function
MPQDRDALIARLESEAGRDPLAYRRRVALLAALGYAYIAFVLLLTVVVVGGIFTLFLWMRLHWFAIQLLLAGFFFAVALARGLWVRFPRPDGIRLEPRAYPALAHLVEDARVRLRAPRVHRTLLTGQFNAAVVQVPRLGLLGWPRNYLLLGLPLLDALSLDETRAVVAHELGHLSGADGMLGGWIYRTRAAWSQLAERLESESHFGTAVLGRFFAWYQPYFDAYSFVAARAQERRADAEGAQLVSARALADALARLPVIGQALAARFWPPIYRNAVSSPEPVGRPFTAMAAALPGLVAPPEGQASLDLALSLPTTHLDTHPCLRERLAALGEPARLPPPPQETAAAALLGAARPRLSERLDADWSRALEKPWADRYESMQRAAKRLAHVDAQGGPPSTNPKEALELALLREEVQGAAAALPYYRAALEANPTEASLRFAVGRVLVEMDQEEGLEVLRPLFDAPPDAVAPAHGLACEYFRRRGNGAEARRHLELALRAEEAMARARGGSAGPTFGP